MNHTQTSAASTQGYLCAVLFLPLLGKRRLQLLGFSMLALVFLIMALAQQALKRSGGAYLFLYAMTFFWSDFGPNTTTFVIPSVIFPTEGARPLVRPSEPSCFIQLTHVHMPISQRCLPLGPADPRLITHRPIHQCLPFPPS
jgi:hypothetical protein